MGPLFALLLLAGQAEPADGPISTKTRPAVTPEQASTPLPGEAEYTPAGAPEDDYAFVGWCHGVLSGHRDLAQKLGAKLTKDAKDKELEADLEKIGAEYLDVYQRALLTAEMSRPLAATERALQAREEGYAKWAPALYAAENGGKDRQGNAVDAEGSYVAWSLPGRCEHASKRLLANGLELLDAYKLKPLATAATTATTQPAASASKSEPEPEPAKADGKSLWSRIKRFGRD
jgi:hypothetical protein